MVSCRCGGEYPDHVRWMEHVRDTAPPVRRVNIRTPTSKRIRIREEERGALAKHTANHTLVHNDEVKYFAKGNE
jgi:hypothetical protein